VSSTRAPARPSCVHGCDLYVNPPGVQGPTRTERNGRGSEHHPSCHDGQRYPLRSSISYTPAGRRQRSSISYILAVFILPFFFPTRSVTRSLIVYVIQLDSIARAPRCQSHSLFFPPLLFWFRKDSAQSTARKFHSQTSKFEIQKNVLIFIFKVFGPVGHSGRGTWTRDRG
jgi:hypothetical protein